MKFIDRLIKFQTYTAICIICVLCGMWFSKEVYNNDAYGSLVVNKETNEKKINTKSTYANKLDKTYMKHYIEVSFPNISEGK